MKKGRGIKEFRERLGIKTQAEFAKKLGVTQTNVSLWERGKGYPSFAQAKKLLEMGATVEELFGVSYQNGGSGVDGEFKEKVLAVLSEVSNSGTIQIGVRG